MKQKYQIVFTIVTVTSLLTLFQNCSATKFSAPSASSSSSNGAEGAQGQGGSGSATGSIDAGGSGPAIGAISGGSGVSGSGGGTIDTLKQVQPALAVRGAACLMCHANVQANLISDFGDLNPFFLDGDKPTGDLNSNDNGNNFAQFYYNPIPWQALQSLSGQVLVPAVTVSDPAVVASGLSASPMSLLSLMTDSLLTNFADSWFFFFSYPNTPFHMAPVYNVTPPAGYSPVVAMQTVYIGAPTAAQISALAPGESTGAVTVSGSSKSPTVGLAVESGTSGPYVMNTAPVSCAGQDVVVTGTLLLRNLQVYAGAGGCRLYVTGAVFIEGPITYLNSTGATVDATQNLQITSAEAVIMGVGLTGESYLAGSFPGDLSNPETTTTGLFPTPNLDPLHNRLIDDTRGLELRDQPTTSSYLSWAQGVYEEGVNIGAELLVDASVTSGAAATSTSEAGQVREAITYNHLLLNAPIVHSRYLGRFNGVVITEMAEFSLGQFVFNFDSVFSSTGVNVLPLLLSNYDILCATNTAGACRPINP